MKRSMVCALLLLSSSVLAQEAKPRFSLTIAAAPRQIRPGRDITLIIQIRNLTDHPILTTRAPVDGSLDAAFQYDVRDSSGNEVKRTPEAESGTVQASAWSRQVQPNDWISSGATISVKSFDIQTAGTYTVQIAQYDPETRQTVLSNQLKVVVDPGASLPNPDSEPEPGLYLELPNEIDMLSDGDLNPLMTWHNATHQIFDCTPRFGASGVDEEFVYDVRTSDGKPVPRLLTYAAQPSARAEDNKPCDIAPRTFFTYRHLGPLMKAFDIRHAGEYTVQVSLPDRANPGKMLAVSNVMTVKVTDPPPGPPLELVLLPDKVVVKPDGKFELKVRWINRSGAPVDCFQGDMEGPLNESYTYDVRDSNGRPVTRVPLEGPMQHSFYTGEQDCGFAPDGKPMEFLVGDLMRAFEMRKPGVYTVRIWRQANFVGGGTIGHDTITAVSNTVTVTVDPNAPS